MCGIVGYIGSKNSIPILLEGLKRLEYRGYDSAGIGIISNVKRETRVIKSLGKVSKLEDKVEHLDIDLSSIGIAHTRWATHGEPSEINAHPHFNKDETLYVVHNGVIENYSEIKAKLIKDGYGFISQTDTEVLVHLIDSFMKKGKLLLKAVQLALSEVKGTYGVCIISKLEPDKIIVARKGSPLVIGIGDGEHYVASDVNALVGHTSHCVYLEDGEIVEVTKDKFTASSIDNEDILKEVHEISVELNEISKGDYPHYMLKEIFEQVNSVHDSFRGRILMDEGTAKLGGIERITGQIANSKRILLSACGTSWHAGLVGEYMLEQFTGLPVEVDYASEFRYRNPIVTKDDAMFFISQSGETADTLAAMKEARRRDALILGICNVVGSSIARESDAGVYVHAGPEIGVASTKAFTSQLVVFALISVLIGRKRHLSLIDGQNILRELELLPKKIEQILKLNDQIEAIAEKFVDAKNFLYLGRGYNFPVALEGALKMKEISYIHAEGYPAAEMKHGPIALIDENMPVVFIAPKDSVYDKVITNIEEVKARKGRIIAIASENDDEIDKLVDFSIKIPDTIRMLMPILTVIPLQLLAYHVAVKKGLNVDQPRNLAKSVTVE
ncbi:MAG: glutamine--fructose-6-phosphate transaminase (isomerizing) [Ignavibacteriales bacterium CG18_big_fil_WC_8_21_14_2_50_31_20]|nr:MAG: glutamine--fructose-6-phosphate transaminase (isomerizing) [Ignavibacteriales bacterium CG18_big_fil_WC_8_21_14_2_50_31_20]